MGYEGGNYEVMVVGGGDGGVEAGVGCGREGGKRVVLSIKVDMVGFMGCNGWVGGGGKGIVVREIDGVGGEMGGNIDKRHIQMGMVNTGKGAGVRALRGE
ncbi:FAD-dependent oxidoreductase, partial [Bacillus sp. WP8]|uniref:FAD-dependent oxidoreductase n=1 Tax=Bacillus sp. WP8 TaxID=756828 RepID=UPI001642B5F2